MKHTFIRLLLEPGLLGLMGQNAAMQAAQGATSGILGLAFGGIQDKRQLKQQKKLQKLQIEGQMEMWKRTNYQAQKEQMEQAGINPALLYGMSGGGGQSANVTGATATQGGGGEMQAMMGMGMQMQLLKAQRENIEADTAKKKVETEKTAGVDTQEAQTRIASITQGIENQKVQQALTEIQDSILRNELYEKYKTQDWRFNILAIEVDKQIAQAQSLMAQANVDQKTQQEKIQILKAQAIGSMLLNTLTNKQIAKTSAETLKIGNDILIDWTKLSLEDKKVKLQGLMQRQTTEQGWQGYNNVRLYYENEQKMIDYIDKLLDIKVNNRNK